MKISRTRLSARTVCSKNRLVLLFNNSLQLSMSKRGSRSYRDGASSNFGVGLGFFANFVDFLPKGAKKDGL